MEPRSLQTKHSAAALDASRPPAAGGTAVAGPGDCEQECISGRGTLDFTGTQKPAAEVPGADGPAPGQGGPRLPPDSASRRAATVCLGRLAARALTTICFAEDRGGGAWDSGSPGSPT